MKRIHVLLILLTTLHSSKSTTPRFRSANVNSTTQADFASVVRYFSGTGVGALVLPSRRGSDDAEEQLLKALHNIASVPVITSQDIHVNDHFTARKHLELSIKECTGKDHDLEQKCFNAYNEGENSIFPAESDEQTTKTQVQTIKNIMGTNLMNITSLSPKLVSICLQKISTGSTTFTYKQSRSKSKIFQPLFQSHEYGICISFSGRIHSNTKPRGNKKNITIKYVTTFVEIHDIWKVPKSTRVFPAETLKTEDLFRKKINPNLINVLPNYEQSYPTSLSMVGNGSADISISPFYVTLDRYQYLDYTTPIFQSPMCLMIKEAPFVPYGLLLLRPYTFQTWMYIVGGSVIFVFAWNIVEICNLRMNRNLFRKRECKESVKLSNLIFELFQILISGSTTWLAHSTVQRFIIASILLFSLVLSNSYTGQILGFLATQPRYPSPKTIEEAEKSLRTVYSIGDFRKELNSSDATQGLKDMARKFHVFKKDDYQRISRNIAEYGKDGMFIPLRHYEIYSRLKNLTVGGVNNLYLVPKCSHLGIYCAPGTTKNSPYFEIFNDFINRVLESSLYNYWRRLHIHQLTVLGVLIPDSSGDTIIAPLSMTHLSGPFLLLILGLTVAAVAFILELVTGSRVAIFLRTKTEQQRNNQPKVTSA